MIGFHAESKIKKTCHRRSATPPATTFNKFVTMPCSEPPRLPTELIELIIDEVPRLSHSSNYSRACTFSALASVSHLFRQCSNKHRFACVSLQRRPLATRARLFLDAAQSTIWKGSNGFSSHIKILSLGVAVRGEGNALT